MMASRGVTPEEDHADDRPLFGGIEAGGTKFVCAIGTGPVHLHAETSFPTTTPAETLDRAIAFFRSRAPGPLAAIGIASFGPLDPDRRSPRFGQITTTPKPGWAFTDVAGAIGGALGVPVGFDTDVNGAALAEHRWGVAQDVETFIYLTVGTGIGGGAMVNGALLHGLLHPEMGHIAVPHDRARDPYAGACPYHGDCFEGLASGPAIAARWGQPAETLPPTHPAWELETEYLSAGLVNCIYSLAPRRIILGGGVMRHAALFPTIRRRVRALLGGYFSPLDDDSTLDAYIVPPALGERAGVLGALALAQSVASSQ